MRVIVICAAIALICSSGSAVRANTFPDVSGTWYSNGKQADRCAIDQSGTFVSLTDERGTRATAIFASPKVLRADWGPFDGGEITGTISNDLRTIAWSNGTSWTRSTGYVPATNKNISPSEPFPYRQILPPKETLQHAPIEVFNLWGAVARDGTWAWVCFSFKNDGSVVATSILFDALLLGADGRTLETLHLDRKGTFSPGAKVNSWQSIQLWMSGLHRGYQDNCTGRRADSEEAIANFKAVHAASYRIERVNFSDGTTWPAR